MYLLKTTELKYKISRGHLTPYLDEFEINCGHAFDSHVLKSNERTVIHPSRNWIRGEVLERSVFHVLVMFNAEGLPWFYDSADSAEEHCFRVYSCIVKSESSIVVRNTLTSDSFQLQNSTSQKKRQQFTFYRVPEPCWPYEKRNRTLDRLHDFFASPGDTPASFEKLLISIGWETIQASDLIVRLSQVQQSYASLLQSPRDINECITKWFDKEDEFNRFCVTEISPASIKNSFMCENEPYVPGVSPPSIRNEFKQVYRKLLTLAIEMSSMSVDSLYEAMRLASGAGMIRMDPCYPPDTKMASTLKRDGCSTDGYSTGQPFFKNEESYKTYAADLLKYRCKIYHATISGRIQGHANSKDSSEDPPADIRIDVTGYWIHEELASSPQFRFPGVFGTLVGNFNAENLMKIYTAIDIEVTSCRLWIRSKSALTLLDFILDSKPVSIAQI